MTWAHLKDHEVPSDFTGNLHFAVEPPWTVADKIKDLPSAREVTDQVDGLDALLKLVKPFEFLLPANTRESLAKSRTDIKQMRETAGQLLNLPDRFNTHFAGRGWIAFGEFSVPAMQQAVDLADQGKMDDAEQVLIEYWTPDVIRWKMTRLKRVEAFLVRVKLAWEAEELYDLGRHAASTMLVLAIADGMVQETSARFLNKNRNLSAEGTDLTAWDSIAGHSSGLNELKKLFFKTRAATNADPIDKPYRHGIMHGMDVNFNTRIVAAKAWAMMFAVGEWALLAQEGKLQAPPPKPTESAFEILKQALETSAETKKLQEAADAFKPRTDWKDGKIPPTGTPNQYGEGTPERAVVNFLAAWTKENYGAMAQLCTGYKNAREDPGRMRDAFRIRRPKDFRLLDVRDETMTRTRIKIELSTDDVLGKATGQFEITLFKKDKDGGPAILTPGEWLIPDYYVLLRGPK